MNISARAFIEEGQLQTGITLLEASAGTGKTYQITNLVVRLVAEHKVPMREILVVTFTKAATAELVDRIRLRLAEAAAVLRGEGEPSERDGMLTSLLARSVENECRREWLQRIVEAQESFDQALISTIHGFCQRMLQQNAFESGAEFGLELMTSDRELISNLVDDYLSAQVNTASLERYRFLVNVCGFSRESLMQTAGAALRDPDMALVPMDLVPSAPADFSDCVVEALSDWDSGSEALGRRFDLGKPTQPNLKKNPESVLFESARGRTYVSSGLKKLDEPVRAWLVACAGPKMPPVPAKVAKYFNRANFDVTLASGVVFEHPLFDEICALVQIGVEVHDGQSSNEKTAPWHGFVAWIRGAYEARKAVDRVVAFQDLLRKLATGLQDDRLKNAIRPRFRAALIDEFQDTDRLQWEIFRTLFQTPQHFLFLIGDPKQAIYGFRGANIHVYVQVKQAADRWLTMDTNFRSDARYVEAMNAVLGRWPASLFDDPNIPYEQVDADALRTPVDRLIPPDSLGDSPWAHTQAAPLQIRFAHGLGEGENEAIKKGDLGASLPVRVAADIVDFLEAGWRLQEHAEDVPRPITPGDIAVLVRSGWQARAVMSSLLEAGVPAVMPAAESVYVSDEALDLQRWLQAIARPTNARTARASAISRLFGWDAAGLRAVDDPDNDSVAWDQWLDWLTRWQLSVLRNGVLSTFRSAMERYDVRGRLLHYPDGERRLTDLLHVLELTHRAEQAQRMGLEGLIRWLADQRQGTIDDDGSAEQRLERDDAAVRILTMHKSKGLQYPVVWAPFLYDGVLVRAADKERLVFPTANDPATRMLDLQQKPFPRQKLAHIQLSASDAHAERIRLLYVALTRARHRCVVYDGKFTDGRIKNGGLEQSSLGLLLHSLSLDAAHEQAEHRFGGVAQRISEMSPNDLYSDLQGWSEACTRDDGSVLVGVSKAALDGELTAWQPVDAAQSEGRLNARVFGRVDPDGAPIGLDLSWKQLSYSSITRIRQTKTVALRSQVLRQEAALAGRDVDQQTDRAQDVARTIQDRLRLALPLAYDETDVPLANFPGGADAGTFLHELFEVMDFQKFPRSPSGDATLGRAELERTLDRLGPKHSMNRSDWRQILHEGLPQVLQTPLGGPLGDLRLADVPRSRRLDELAFDLPVAGGAAHRRPQADGHVPWPERVSGAAFGQAFGLAAGSGPSATYLNGLKNAWQDQDFAGFLTGSIDLVFATDPQAGAQRFYVVDYKSNKLDHLREGEHPSAHFCQAWMRYEMEHHDYFVQATLYSVAVHRYLEHRIPDYDYDTHHGGALYLFFRGMVGEETLVDGGSPMGVYPYRPPRALIEHLDDLLEGRVQ